MGNKTGSLLGLRRKQAKLRVKMRGQDQRSFGQACCPLVKVALLTSRAFYPTLLVNHNLSSRIVSPTSCS